MSKNSNRSGRNVPFRIRSERRKHPDISKITRAVIGLALHEAALEAAAQRTAALRAESPHPSVEHGVEGDIRD